MGEAQSSVRMDRDYPQRRGVSRPRRRAAHSYALLTRGRPLHRLASARRERGGGNVGRVVGVLALGMLVAAASGVVVAGSAATAVIGALSTELPDPASLMTIRYPQPTIIYDRTGKVELGRFAQEERRVVTFDQVPKLVLDATTTAEDRTFWSNEGYDPAAIVAAIANNASGATERGASTITQQLVRARLLPDQATSPEANRYLRKAEEIIQSARLTKAFPGEPGKQLIMASYLNQIFYGHDAYGIAAAAKVFFGVSDLAKLTPAQAALLAGLPKSPTALDPFRFAKRDAKGRLVVPQDAPPVIRRNWVLAGLAQARWTHLSADEIAAASKEPVVLAVKPPIHFRAPHFVWKVRDALVEQLGSLEDVETGGYRVITTLDWRAQSIAEKYVTAAAILPHLKPAARTKLARSLKLSSADRQWAYRLIGRGTHNGCLIAIDYRTGDVLAYVGSAGYERDDLKSRLFEPKYDVAGDGFRQPGSAFKPIVYATAFERRVLTPGSLLLDVTTEFGRDWAPHDADQLERGPVLQRQALQFSLNIPAIRAMQRVSNKAVAAQAKALGITFMGGQKAFTQAGLSAAIGTVEVHPIDLTAAFGALANGGQLAARRLILEIDGPDGKVVHRAAPRLTKAISPQAAFLISSVLAGNTDPSQNPIWADSLAVRNGPHGTRRPAAAKTGTTNETRDFTTFGYLAPPRAPNQPGLAVGVWMGNSDHSEPRGREVTSLDGPSRVWQAFMRDYSRHTPVASFRPPKGVVEATIDAWTGGKPGPWTRQRTQEWFISGTQPGSAHAIDRPGLMYRQACGGWAVDLVQAELGPAAWDDDVANWMRRARGGTGRRGSEGTSTAYLFGRHGWGGPIAGPCKPKPKPTPPEEENCKGNKCPPAPSPTPTPTPTPAAAPSTAPRRIRRRRLGRSILASTGTRRARLARETSLASSGVDDIG
jgi:membrane peptidoglycan carboxypeptidase